MEVLGTIAGFSTVIYNGIRTLGEVNGLIKKLKARWKTKEVTPKSDNMSTLEMLIHLKDRWNAESPELFNKFKQWGVGFMSCGFTAVVPEIIIPTKIMERIHWPTWIATYGGYFIAAGFCIFCLSKLTCKDVPELPNVNKKADESQPQ
jgi:hypothetical protein